MTFAREQLLRQEKVLEEIRVQEPANDDVNGWMLYLHGEEKGIKGARPGNRRRMSRRKWIETMVLVQDKVSQKMIPFVLNEAQRNLEATILRMERMGVPVRVAILKARQQGCSTYIAAAAIWFVCTHDHTRAMIMAHKKDVAKIIHERATLMLNTLRRDGLGSWGLKLQRTNAQRLQLAEPIGGSIIIDSAEAPDYVGDTIPFFHISEAPKWPNDKAKAGAVLQMVPQAPGTYVFNEATAEGDTGWFAELWKEGWRRRFRPEERDRLGSVSLFWPWFWHEKYRYSVVSGRPLPEKLADEIEATLDEEEQWLRAQRFLRRKVGMVAVSYDQLAWRRWCIRENCQGSLDKFHQEYPAKPEEAFLASGLRLFDALKVQQQRDKNVRPVGWRGDIVDFEGERLLQRTLSDMLIEEEIDARPAG